MIGTGQMRSLATCGILGLAVVGAACGEPPPKAPQTYDYTKAQYADADSKALMYNLIGRWFPEAEIRRLDDDSMTPEAWCARNPSHIMVHLDEVDVQCDEGLPFAAAIARVERHESGGIQVVLRAAEDAKLKSLLFEDVIGTGARITGSPCFEGAATNHARFPKIEILRRQILGGRRCAQIVDPTASTAPAPSSPGVNGGVAGYMPVRK